MKYTCEVCRTNYATPEEALACEAKPRRALPPAGLILTTQYLEWGLFAGLAMGRAQASGHLDALVWHWHRPGGFDDQAPRSDVLQSWPISGPDTDTTAPVAMRARDRCIQLGWQPLILRGGEVVAWVAP